jgi:hypothetical protein
MSRKSHAPGAGGGKEKGRTAGDQQTGGVTGGKLGGSGSLRYHTNAPGRASEAGRMGGQSRAAGKPAQRQRSPEDKSGE